MLDIRDQLQEEEKEIFFEIILNYEVIITFDQKEYTKIYEDISPLIIIKIIPYKVQQEKNFPYPKALFLVITKILLERLD